MGLRDLPEANGERHAKCFERFGWTRSRRGRTSHIIMEKPGESATLSIPSPKGKKVKRKLLAGLIKAAGISERDYIRKFK